MRAITVTLCLTLMGSATMGETFKLKDTATNKEHGPFNFMHGSQIKIGETEWKLERIDPRRDELAAKMKKIKIPSLDFRDAKLEDVVLFLSETIKRLGHEDMRIVLSPDANTDEPQSATISIRDMSLQDTLAYICEMTHTEWNIRNGVIMLDARDSGEKSSAPTKTTGTKGTAPFYLKNTGTKEMYGPFQLKNKAYIRIDETILAIHQDASQTKVIASLKEAQLPQFKFRDASTEDVVVFLNEIIKRQSPTLDIKLALEDKVDPEKHRVSCSLQKKSLYDVVNILCEVADLQWTIRKGVVVLEKCP